MSLNRATFFMRKPAMDLLPAMNKIPTGHAERASKRSLLSLTICESFSVFLTPDGW